MEARLQLAGVLVGMMQLDIVLPSQQFARRKQTPEQRLMTAILHDAIECVEKHRWATDPGGRRLFHEARRWFLIDEANWPYSFQCICGILDLDADAVRQRLRVTPECLPVPRPAPPAPTPEASDRARLEVSTQRLGRSLTVLSEQAQTDV